MRLTVWFFAVATAVQAAEPALVTVRNELINQGNEAFYNLDYAQSLALYEKALALDPLDPTVHNHVAHALLYGELFRNGALESELVSGNNSFIRRAKMEPAADIEARFFAEINQSMRLSNARIMQFPRDTAALHALSVAYALRANYGFLVRKSWIASLSDSNQARKYDNRVTDINPDDYDARLLQGGYDYIVGSLSWSMRALGLVAGYRGDRKRGLKMIEEVAKKGVENRVDAEIVLCALYRREGRPESAVPLVVGLIGRFPRNYLLRFELAQMYAALGKRPEALYTLREVSRLKGEQVPGFERVAWEKINYETGNLQFWFDNFDEAMASLRSVTATPEQLGELDLNTGALAFMRQGQILDLKQQHSAAIERYRQAIRFASDTDAAKESQGYLARPYSRQ